MEIMEWIVKPQSNKVDDGFCFIKLVFKGKEKD